jgi:hypothetical protein
MGPQPRLHPIAPGVEGTRAGIPAHPSFAHASEAELARILDFYGVAWEYEPRPFPLLWNQRGQVVESFTPDFYLPELDLYVELTTLRQKLVRKKNRKLRRLRALYPDVRVKLLYAKDFRALMLKFGRIGLADALSGTVGQTTPPKGTRGGSAPPAVAHAGDAGEVEAASLHMTVTTALSAEQAAPVPAGGGPTEVRPAHRPRRRRRPDAEGRR